MRGNAEDGARSWHRAPQSGPDRSPVIPLESIHWIAMAKEDGGHAVGGGHILGVRSLIFGSWFLVLCTWCFAFVERCLLLFSLLLAAYRLLPSLY